MSGRSRVRQLLTLRRNRAAHKPKPGPIGLTVTPFYKRKNTTGWSGVPRIFFSQVALIVLDIPMAIVALIIWIDSPGASPIFSQDRVGRDEKVFKFYKFRPMVSNAEAKLKEVLDQNEMDGPVFKMKNDPRITRVGHFI